MPNFNFGIVQEGKKDIAESVQQICIIWVKSEGENTPVIQWNDTVYECGMKNEL